MVKMKMQRDKISSIIRYLQKATQLDRLLGPAWLAYGHSFAVENEHDQAMAAYFKVSNRRRVEQAYIMIS